MAENDSQNTEAKGAAQGEPSMEEILASIRRIIAEDGDAAAQPAAGATPAAEAPPADAEEILELTEVLEEEEAPEAPLAAEPAPPPLIAPATPSFGPRPQTAAERLVSQPTAELSVAALSQLAAMREQRRDTSMPLGNGQLTIEQLVRDLLRPMLREWLDANLPSLVERLVRDEIARMVREAQH
jgi:hypothetical protein